MGGYVYSQTDSGIVRADLGSDGAAVARALREHDPDLRLIPGLPNANIPWKVYRYAGSERDAEFVTAWMTDRGEALPLSMALVDEVQRLDRNMRGFERNDPDEENRKLIEERRAEELEEIEAAFEDWEPRARTGRLPVFHRSPALAAARRRGRRRGVSYG